MDSMLTLNKSARGSTISYRVGDFVLTKHYKSSFRPGLTRHRTSNGTIYWTVITDDTVGVLIQYPDKTKRFIKATSLINTDNKWKLYDHASKEVIVLPD